MAKTAPYQLQKTGIRVNAICPGLIETGMTTFTFEYAKNRGTQAKIGQLNPLGRYGIAEGEYLSCDSTALINLRSLRDCERRVVLGVRFVSILYPHAPGPR